MKEVPIFHIIETIHNVQNKLIDNSHTHTHIHIHIHIYYNVWYDKIAVFKTNSNLTSRHVRIDVGIRMLHAHQLLLTLTHQTLHCTRLYLHNQYITSHHITSHHITSHPSSQSHGITRYSLMSCMSNHISFHKINKYQSLFQHTPTHTLTHTHTHTHSLPPSFTLRHSLTHTHSLTRIQMHISIKSSSHTCCFHNE